ncbi:unnamed protein product [Caenorhabditis angaria]|uniref:Retinoid-inducible serine carboxypeptidase n=1 Tax=Caenorhabditis angaria TaxID=860376 RepID=A0A9P1N6L9_9PELO|nr:unnamed protein product [Caenorhabditis angaria]
MSIVIIAPLIFLCQLISAQQLLTNPRCNYWPDRGTCENQEFVVKWYYDRYDHRCRRFFYGGCEGNDNRYDSLEECTSQCQFIEPDNNRNRCFQPHDPGTCSSDIERWYFDQVAKRCVCSWWSGCGGNSNIYYSYNHCMLICGEFAEQGPAIDEKYWNRIRNNQTMSLESQMVFGGAHLDIEKPDEGYRVEVPSEKMARSFISISHQDDSPQYLHSAPLTEIHQDGVTIHRYDSAPRQLQELPQPNMIPEDHQNPNSYRMKFQESSNYDRVSASLRNEAEETQRRIQESMRKDSFRTAPQRDIVAQFKSHLEEHERSLRAKLEAQFPGYDIVLTPEIETVRHPDGRNVVRQRIQWTAVPKGAGPKPEARPEIQARSELPQTRPGIQTKPEFQPATPNPTEAQWTLAPHDEAWAARQAEKRRYLEERARKKAARYSTTTTTRAPEPATVTTSDDRIYIPTVTYPVPLEEESTPPPTTTESWEAKRQEWEAQRRKEAERRRQEWLRQQTTTTTTSTTQAPTTITQRAPAEPVEHYRPLIEHVTPAPLSIEDIIEIGDQKQNYIEEEDDYDVPMDFPETTRRPRVIYSTPRPTRRPEPMPPRNTPRPALSLPIVSPPTQKPKSKLFAPPDSDEYAQDVDFDPYINMIFWAFLGLVSQIPAIFAGAHNTVNTWDGLLQYDEDWGYVDIRKNAHTFWWLYAVKPANQNRPLFVWLQGGPGSSGTGFGNFEETGPKTLNGTDNPATWLQVADIVYVDNPVGTGFSYVDDSSALTTNITQIGDDLLVWLRKFLALHSEYRTRPFYIFCESYGGKMSTQFAKVITDAVKSSSLILNFRAVALGDSWISAMDYVNTWGPYLYANSYLDDHQLHVVQTQASHCQSLVDQQKWTQATNCWGNMEELIGAETNDVSWYNILKQGGTDDWSSSAAQKIDNRIKSPLARLFDRHVRPQNLDSMADYMNTVVRQKLGIIPDAVRFGAQGGAVFNAQADDFMTPIWGTVEELLKDGYNVVVFNGNEDLICNTMGTAAWVNRLTWDGMISFNTTVRHHFGTKSFPLAGYHKTHANFQFWWILRAGHMVAYDTPEAAIYMLKAIVKQYNQ